MASASQGTQTSPGNIKPGTRLTAEQRKNLEAMKGKSKFTTPLIQRILDSDTALAAAESDQAKREELLTSAPSALQSQSQAIARATAKRNRAVAQASGAKVNAPTKPGAGKTAGQAGNILGGTRNYGRVN